jgi:hypothetical protein
MPSSRNRSELRPRGRQRGHRVAGYKDKVKREYIFKEPMKAYAYYALFQT